jgi:hypothetical protein
VLAAVERGFVVVVTARADSLVRIRRVISPSASSELSAGSAARPGETDLVTTSLEDDTVAEPGDWASRQ